MLTTVAAFREPWEAHMFCSRLEAEGVPAFIAHEYHIWNAWRKTIPSRNLRVAWRQLRIGGDNTQLLLTCQHFLAVPVPAFVELAFVQVAPLLVDLVRRVGGTGGEIQEEGFFGRE